MPYEVFISYSKPDKITADAVCGTLEAQGVRCWIAPRDVEPGRDWSESIIEALNVCPVMVLVFSSHANESPHVRREVQRAFGKNVTVIPFRVENVRPVESLEYYLGPVHWLDALTPPLDRYLQQLSGTVKRLLADRPIPEPREAVAAVPPDSSTATQPPSAQQPAPPAGRPPGVVHLPSPPAAVPIAATATAAASPAVRENDGAKRRSPALTLGVCSIAALTIVGLAFVLRSESSRLATADQAEELPVATRLPRVQLAEPMDLTETTQDPALRDDHRDKLHPVVTMGTRVTGGESPDSTSLDSLLFPNHQPTANEATPALPAEAWRALTSGRVVTIVNGRMVVEDASNETQAEEATPLGEGPVSGDDWMVPTQKFLIPQATEDDVPSAEAWRALTGGRVVTIVNGRAVVEDASNETQAEEATPPGEGPVWGDDWMVPALDLEMIFISPGTFTMGSPAKEKQREDGEGPPTRVTLTQGFWLGKHEVTRDQWMSVMHVPTRMPSEPVDGETPIVMVAWTDAMEFCQALNAHERAANRLPSGYAYTLPTEAQWEYACRAGTTTPFHYGEQLGSALANFNGQEPYGGAPKGDFHAGPLPVGNFPPNAWGFHDMHGNVWEWTSSGLAKKRPGNSIEDYDTPATGGVHVMRGGSWQDAGWSCRSAMRSAAAANMSADSFGFRLALAPAR